MSSTQQALAADKLMDDAGPWSRVEGFVSLDSVAPKLDRFLLWIDGASTFFQ